MQVLIVAPWARRLGGAEEMLWAFLRTHPREEIGVAVVFLEDGPFEREVAELGIATLVIEAGRLRSPVRLIRTVGHLALTLRRRRPDVVLNWMAKTQLYGSPAATLSRVDPTVVWWQHLTPQGHWMDGLATALPTAAIGASSEASAAAQRRKWPQRRTFCVHPGIDVSAGDAAQPTRAALGLDAAAVLIVLVGRLQPWKGQHRAIEALALLRTAGVDAQLLVVGGAAFGFDEDYEHELRRLVDRRGLFAHVVFTGQVDETHPYLELADIALNASESEPFGIVVIEALARGVAVVAVDAGGPAEVLTDGVDGLLAADGSPEAMAKAIGQAARDSNLRVRLAVAGRKRYEEDFTAAAMSRRITDRLREVSR